MQYYLKDSNEVIVELESSMEGLSTNEANKRFIKNGPNELEMIKSDSLFKKFIEQIKDPMIIILIISALISGVMASFKPDEGYMDVIIIIIVVLVNAILGVYQESKAEKAIEALGKMSSPTSKVIRDNKLQIIKSSDLVVGDIITLEAGDIIPADARIIKCASLKVEEASLTGESMAVDKTEETLFSEVPLGDRNNMLFMSGVVVYGRAEAIITQTGMNTQMGKIADAISKAKDNETPLQIKLNQLSKVLTWLVLGICMLVFTVQVVRVKSLDIDFILDSFMIAVSLAVAAIPEGLVAVVTVVLSIGVTNMSKQKAIIRKLTAVETLGSANVICSDKTGTLTQNKMSVTKTYGEDPKLIATVMSLCNDAEIDDNNQIVGEPTEVALVAYAQKLSLNKNILKKEYPRILEAPFDSNRKMMTTIHQSSEGIISFTKGASDVILKCCGYILKNGQIQKISDEDLEEILAANKEMADKALRILACAIKKYDELPKTSEASILENELCFVGLVGMIDPIRPEVKAAIDECKKAHIKTIMITGDHKDTAVAIAKDLGILNEDEIAITGQELNEMSDEIFSNSFDKISVYARVQPEHKTRIVNAWMSHGFVTAMTGDGVNDAPSIKSADIGVGMGITGTDVTKNVADMVLADDNFATIVSAIKEGRRIFDNIKKSIQFLLASNMAEVLAIFISTLMGFTILKPVHLLWINLVTDSFPALALGVEKAENDIMLRKPRNVKESVFAEGMGFNIVYQGILVTILVIISYFIGHYIEFNNFDFTNSNHGMTMAFLTMSMAEIFHSLNMRSIKKSIFKLDSHNKLLYLASFISLITTTLVCEVPFLANAFGFVSVGVKEYFIAISMGFSVIPIVEFVKYIKIRISQ